MDKKLPNIYANPIQKKLQNVQEMYYGEDRVGVNKDDKPVLKKINEIFSSLDFVYKSRVRITTMSGSREYVLVGRTDKSLLTFDNETVLIADILEIQKN